VVAVIATVLIAVVLLRMSTPGPPSTTPGGAPGSNDTGGPGGPTGSGSTPIGSALSLGTPSETVVGADHWVNFTVVSAEAGLDAENVVFQVDVSSTGAILTPGGNWTMTVLDLAGSPVSAYAFAPGDWTSGMTVAISSSEQFSLYSGTSDLGGQGDVLKVFGTGEYGGTTSVDIP
jgi:hypothetical protein